MGSQHVWILAAGSLLVTGCNPSFDAEEKNNKREITSGRDEVTLRLAAASEAGGDLGGAEKMYITLAKNGSTPSVMELAAFYTRHNQAGRAVEILSAAYRKSPNDMNLMRSLANSLISAGNPQKALLLLDGAIAGHTDLAYIYNSRGVALDKLERYGEAQSSYRKAIALNPQDEVDFKTNLSMSYIVSGRYNDAIALLAPLMADKTATSGVRQNLALAYGLKGDMDKAMKMGSKDLTIRQMNENIRFYTLVTQGKTRHSSVATESADVFPALASPPVPTPEDTPPEMDADPIASPPLDGGEAPHAPAAPVRNLSYAPASALPKPMVPPAPDAASPQMKIIRPAAAKMPYVTQENDATSAVAPIGDIPVPMLKPDKW